MNWCISVIKIEFTITLLPPNHPANKSNKLTECNLPKSIIMCQIVREMKSVNVTMWKSHLVTHLMQSNLRMLYTLA